ncbi:hypothetical protein Y032_0006g2891 [Ancylostoma ceylanicum]|nr:hypothetical protein Y032_0006g2891 [Ancylostoma ceylanicum]
MLKPWRRKFPWVLPLRSISRSNKAEARRRTLCLVTPSNIVLVAHSNPEIQIFYSHQLIAQNRQRAKYVTATVYLCALVKL